MWLYIILWYGTSMPYKGPELNGDRATSEDDLKVEKVCQTLTLCQRRLISLMVRTVFALSEWSWHGTSTTPSFPRWVSLRLWILLQGQLEITSMRFFQKQQNKTVKRVYNFEIFSILTSLFNWFRFENYMLSMLFHAFVVSNLFWYSD